MVNKKNRRAVVFIIVLALMLNLAVPAFASDTAAAMRLVAAEGTVTVTNASGKAVSIKEDMRLYHGYTVKTGQGSYAYISLDSSKAVKLDASSQVTLNQSGRKLEVKLISGKLFFNVQLPLKADETLNIRTSTMVTGIRGTSGWIDAASRFESVLYLLDGKVQAYCTDPASGRRMQAEVAAGQTIRSVPEDLAGIADGQQMLILDRYDEGAVPGFVREEIAEDPELQQKIREQTDLNVEELITGADDCRRDEEAAAEKQMQMIQEKEQAQQTDKVTPVFQLKEEPLPAAPSVTPSAPTQEPTPVEYVLKEPIDVQTIQDALRDPANTTVAVEVSPEQGLSIQENLDVPAHKTLKLTGSGKTTLSKDKEVNIAGTMIVDKGSELLNNGTINVNSKDSLHISGRLVNAGNIAVGMNSSAGGLYVEPGGIVDEEQTDEGLPPMITIGGESDSLESLMVIKEGAQSSAAITLYGENSILEDRREQLTGSELVKVQGINGKLICPNGVTFTEGPWEMNMPFTGDITVAEGATLVAGEAVIEGNITVAEGAALNAAGATITGNITADNRTEVNITGATIIGNINAADGAKIIGLTADIEAEIEENTAGSDLSGAE